MFLGVAFPHVLDPHAKRQCAAGIESDGWLYGYALVVTALLLTQNRTDDEDLVQEPASCEDRE